MKPLGILSNGKPFYADANHPDSQTFTGQEHAEAAQNLVQRSRHMMTGKHLQHDEFAIQHAKRLSEAARSHGQAAKVKMPRAQAAPRRSLRVLKG
jgi:hypothetical protein